MRTEQGRLVDPMAASIPSVDCDCEAHYVCRQHVPRNLTDMHGSGQHRFAGATSEDKLHFIDSNGSLKCTSQWSADSCKNGPTMIHVGAATMGGR